MNILSATTINELGVIYMVCSLQIFILL